MSHNRRSFLATACSLVLMGAGCASPRYEAEGAAVCMKLLAATTDTVALLISKAQVYPGGAPGHVVIFTRSPIKCASVWEKALAAKRGDL